MRRGRSSLYLADDPRKPRPSPAGVKWFTSLVSRGDNLPPLYRLLTEVGAVKVVKKEMAQGQKQSRFIASELYGRRQTPSSILTLLGGRAVGARHRQLLPVCTGARTPARSKCFFTRVSRAKRTVHCFSGRVVKLTRSVKAVLLSPTSPANDGSPMIRPRISSPGQQIVHRCLQRPAGFIQILMAVNVIVSHNRANAAHEVGKGGDRGPRE